MAFSILFTLTICGVYANWLYAQMCEEKTSIPISLNDFLNKPKESIYIKSVELFSNSNNVSISNYNYSYPTYLTTIASSSQSGGTMIYKITVFNNTDYTYNYMGVSFEETYANNSYVNVQNGLNIIEKDLYTELNPTFNTDDIVSPRQTRTFYATYTFGSNVVNREIETMVNFKFSIR